MKLDVLSFFQDIFNFLRAGSVLGVDIGTTSIKLSEVSKKGEKFKLLKYGILRTKNYLKASNRAIQTSSLEIDEIETAEFLKIALSEMKPKTTTALVSIPSFSAFVVPLDMPLLSPEETAKSVMFQARRYVPLPADKVSIDWIKVEEFESAKGEKTQRILLIGVPNELIRKYKSIFKSVGLRLVALEVESITLARSLSGLSAQTIVVDIGTESTTIAVVERGVLKYSSQTDYGGVYLTQALSRSLGINAMRAEELKQRRGLLGQDGESELSTLLLPFLDVIIQEARHTKDSYERRYSKKIDQLVLVGGGANLLGVEDYFKKQLNLPLVVPPTFSNFEYNPELEPTIKNLARELPITIGLAKKYYS